MFKSGKGKLSLLFALAFVIFSFPLTAFAEGEASAQSKGEVIEYAENPESAGTDESNTESTQYEKGESLGADEGTAHHCSRPCGTSPRNEGFCGRYGVYRGRYRFCRKRKDD